MYIILEPVQYNGSFKNYFKFNILSKSGTSRFGFTSFEALLTIHKTTTPTL